MLAATTDMPARLRVLDSAAHRFVSQGYAATTLRQIAGDAGIKAASIYHHFDSKESLFTAVLDDGIAVMVRAFDQVPTTGPAPARLQRHVRAHLGALFEHGPYTAAHVTAFFTAPPSVRKTVVPVRDSYEMLWNELLGELLPHIPVARRPLVRLVLFGSMNSTIEWFDPLGDTSLDELAELLTNQFLNGAS